MFQRYKNHTAISWLYARYLNTHSPLHGIWLVLHSIGDMGMVIEVLQGDAVSGFTGMFLFS